MAIIAEGRGHFDPDVADAFMAIHARFKQTAFALADSEEARNARYGRIIPTHLLHRFGAVLVQASQASRIVLILRASSCVERGFWIKLIPSSSTP